MPFAVWLRTMTSYSDHFYKSLQYKNQLNILKLLTYDYETFDLALNWVLINGRNVTKKFREVYNQPCAFVIYDKKIESIDQIDFDTKNIPDMYWSEPRCAKIVFSKQGYDMLLREHFIFFSHDWANAFPGLIFYIRVSDINETKFEPGNDFVHFESDKTYIDHGIRSDDEPDDELEISEHDNNKEIICGCNDSYFEMQVNKLSFGKERTVNEFNEFKENRDSLVTVYNSYCQDKVGINELAAHLKNFV